MGVVIGLKTNLTYNPIYTVYISLIVLAIINTILNILVENSKKETSSKDCLVMLAADVSIALVLGFVGEQLGLPLYLAAIFAFGNSIYKNFRVIFNKFIVKKDI